MPLRYAEDVPSEIWEKCWTFAERYNLPALSLTCRLFNDICKPKLFEQLVFNLPNPRLESFYSAAPILYSLKRRYKELSSNGQLNKHLRTETYRALLDLINSSISQFSRLQRISIGPVPLGAELMENLRSLQQLDRVHLDTAAGLDLPDSTPPLRVSEFNYHEYALNRTLPTPKLPIIISSEHLQHMWLSGPYAYDILYSFICHGRPFERLRSLLFPMKSSDILLFFDFLLICPVLEKLRIKNFQNLAHVVSAQLPAIPTSAAPRLTDYMGPDAIAAALAPGRPMSTTVMVNPASAIHKLTTTDYASLGRSSPPIASLSLGLRYMNRAAFHDLARYLPQLQKFTVHIEAMGSIIPEDAITYLDLLSELKSGTVPLPQALRALGLRPYPHFTSIAQSYPINEQRRLLATLSSRYLELREASLGIPCVDWKKQGSVDSRCQESVWVQSKIADMFPDFCRDTHP
ncbi:hypothetical protein CPB83DRAFT_907582 [Crepidotus variabilis]|uniref:F-box domain-containing protein n=1 Tax=Crepidotus variabilis TaxID=179855 RepID=A0A9P6EEI9_9AGAR|nr:hypothetical protein CPB83DRAFT_907582 [Crepidotus variabilis]